MFKTFAFAIGVAIEATAAMPAHAFIPISGNGTSFNGVTANAMTQNAMT
jgi:hypothetical protein